MADLTSSKIYGNLDVTRDVNILNNLALDGYLSKNVKINLNSQNDFSTVFSSPHLKLTSDNYVNTTGTTSIALSTSPVDNYGVSLMGLRYGTTGAPNFVLKIHNNSVSGIEAIRVIENGDVGINLTNPTVRLDVIDDSISEGFRVRHSNLTQGISIGYNTITANGTNPDQNISINCKGTGTLSVNTDINIPTGKLYKINGVALNVVAGNGLSGGGNLSPGSTLYVNFGSTAGTVCQGNDSRLSDARTPTSHTHGNITNAGAIGTAADFVVTTTTGGVLTTSSRSGIDSRTAFPVTFGTTAGTVCQGNDSRLSDARTPTSHTHGNITNAGAIGTTADFVVTTTTGGVLTTSSRSGIDSRTAFPVTFGTTAGTVCQGNDSRLSDARTPTSHNHGTGTAGYLTKFTDTSGNIGNSPVYTDGTNFSFGTTSPLTGVAQTNSNTTTLSSHYGQLALMDANAYSVSDAGGIMYFGGNYTASAVTTWAAIRGTKENTTSGQYGGNLVFFTRANGYVLSTGERMRILSNGNVGIGTNNPTAHVAGAKALIVSGIDVNNRAVIELWGQSSGKTLMQSVSGDSYFGNVAKGTGNGNVNFVYGNGTVGATMLGSNGYLGINTASPSEVLTVQGPRIRLESASSPTGYYLTINEQYSYANPVSFQYYANTGAVGEFLGIYQSSTNRYTSLGNLGNVGIGTTAPNEKLDIAGNVKIQEENSVKFAGTGASDSKYEICYNATDNSLCFNYIG